MKVNIFRIPSQELDNVQTRLRSAGMRVIQDVEQDGWKGKFYYSTDPKPGEVEWAETFRAYFEDIDAPESLSYFATFLFTKGDACFALSYGKAHFYLRGHSDYDFGIELAKRIANEQEIKQTSSKRFQGRKVKDIKSFTSNTRLNIESGESVDYLQASIQNDLSEVFGQSGKFGTSALLSPPISKGEIGIFLTSLAEEIEKPAQFKLPRTTVISEAEDVKKYDELLIAELTSEVGSTELSHDSYELYGVDFVFSNHGTFKVWCPKYPREDFSNLNMKDLKGYISRNKIDRADILGLRITHEHEGRPKYTVRVKEAVDFIVDSERVLLSGGKWMHFNQDYLEFLDEYLSSIAIEDVEPQFQQIAMKEGVFNASKSIEEAGYELADKDFEIFRTRSRTPTEAWDLKKGSSVYAVKFGTPQRLGYVCDQAASVLELFRNKAEVNTIPHFDKYCIWLGYKSKGRISKIEDSGSIILKQKIEVWARKCRELGVEPVIKLSQRVVE